MVELTNIFLDQLILEAKSKGYSLSYLIFHFDWRVIRWLVVGEVNIDQSRWENKKALNRSYKVPTSFIDMLGINGLGNWIIHNPILNGLNRANTNKHEDKYRQQWAHTASDSA